MIYCPYCKREMEMYDDTNYICVHEGYSVIISMYNMYDSETKTIINIFDSISILLNLPHARIYEIYMIISDDGKKTYINQYDHFPDNIFTVHILDIKEVTSFNGFLFDYGELNYDKIVSKLNMVLNFQ